jgi:hypothetical protein
MEALQLSTLIITIILIVERIISKVKHCRSGCCELDMKEATSPKNVALDKV